MITPQFACDQDEEFVLLRIRAPYLRATNIEFVVDDDLFVFSLSPYYLRLRFPGKLVDDERATSDYDLSTGVISVKIPKENKGEDFADLDMISKLLARKGGDQEPRKKPLIVELDDDSQPTNNPEDFPDDFDWEISQEPATVPSVSVKYGFDNGYSDRIGLSVANGNDINELSSPETLSPEERHKERMILEDEKFDPDYYLADLMDNPDIGEFILWQCSPVELTSDDNDRLTKLSKRKPIVTNVRETYIGLVSFLFGACYDCRINLGDSTVESAWTVGKLCPQLSCLDGDFPTVGSIMVCCSRRALAYPLYRHWELVIKVWQDVYAILLNGKKAILKKLVDLLRTFETDLYVVYNQIWIEDYTLWIQYAQDTVIRSLAHEMHKVNLTKEEIGWDIEELEEAARGAMADATNE
jgi:protein SHQ1